jgi:hypothetical protein
MKLKTSEEIKIDMLIGPTCPVTQIAKNPISAIR